MTSEANENVAVRVREFVFQRFPLARELKPSDDESLLESGIVDSLGILDLVTFLEESLEIVAEDDDLNPENFDSISSLVRFVEAKRA